MTDISASEEIYSVSQLNREIRVLLETTLPYVWVEGEVSNFAAPRSGHWYFSLKDANAQVRCAMFRGHQTHGLRLADGMQILARARVSLYEGRGDFQLLIERVEDMGEGKLQRAFEALKKRLAAAGWFDAAHKKPFPLFPKTIGVVTSPTGAAIRDILSVLQRRYACADVIIYPAQVQGAAAAATIVRAIETANRRAECDVLLVARGGGSLEDLWPFNEESVAYAIYHSVIPVISGVGHETDFTIADFVADARAPTPSVAAESVTPDASELLDKIKHFGARLLRAQRQQLQALMQQLGYVNKHLQQVHPLRRLQTIMQQLDFYEITLMRQLQATLLQRQQAFVWLQEKMQRLSPVQQISLFSQQLSLYLEQLMTAMHAKLHDHRQALAHLSAQLHVLSPLAVLQRGFAIATQLPSHAILRDAREVTSGSEVAVQLARGKLICIIKESQYV